MRRQPEITPEVRGCDNQERQENLQDVYPLGDRYKNCLLLRLREGGEPAVDMSSNREIVSLHAF